MIVRGDMSASNSKPTLIKQATTVTLTRLVRQYGSAHNRDELHATGLLAIVEAAEAFDSERNVPWLAFAWERSRNAIVNHLRGERRDARLQHAVRNAQLAMRDQLDDGRTPLLDEKTATSRLQLVCDRLTMALMYSEVADADPERLLTKKQSFQALRYAVEGLPEPDQSIIRARYDDAASFREVSSSLNMPSSTVRDHHNRALDLMRQTLLAHM